MKTFMSIPGIKDTEAEEYLGHFNWERKFTEHCYPPWASLSFLETLESIGTED